MITRTDDVLRTYDGRSLQVNWVEGGEALGYGGRCHRRYRCCPIDLANMLMVMEHVMYQQVHVITSVQYRGVLAPTKRPMCARLCCRL